MIIDLFAGGGGASCGIEAATGEPVDVAINHDEAAIECHKLNHPRTLHLKKSVFEPDPLQVTGGRGVDLLWLSPDCRHFSRAKGARPVSKKIRALAWVTLKWAKKVKPTTIILENVREFQLWGPVVPAWKCRACNWRGTEGQTTLARTRRRCPRCESLRLTITEDQLPDPARQGQTFKLFVSRLRGLGYTVEWKNLNAADFGTPTLRRRLFLVASLNSVPAWPEPTHCEPKKVAATGLLPWRQAAECIDWSIPCPSIFGRKKDLADKTLRRIAMGLQRYVLESPEPFIVQVNHGGADFRGQSLDRPIPTQTGKLGMAMCVPSMVQIGYGERRGQSPRILDIQSPLGTVVGGGGKHALVAAMLAKFRFDSAGGDLRDPLPTITAGGNAGGRGAGAAHAMGLTAVYLARFCHGEKQWNAVDEPLGTITSQGNKFGLVYAFLIRYFGQSLSAHQLNQPLGTMCGQNKFGLVQVEVEAGRMEAAVGVHIPDVGPCIIADIGLRMLDPAELMLAQGFPADYRIPGSKAQKVKLIGNSVPPPLARAVVAANMGVLV